jgi:hypothetical protein
MASLTGVPGPIYFALFQARFCPGLVVPSPYYQSLTRLKWAVGALVSDLRPIARVWGARNIDIFLHLDTVQDDVHGVDSGPASQHTGTGGHPVITQMHTLGCQAFRR